MPDRARWRKIQAARESPVQVYARVTGSLEFLCPLCGKMKNFTKMNLRHPKWKCYGCAKVWSIGLGFFLTPPRQLPPFNAIWFDYLPERGINNLVIEESIPSRPAIARTTGNVEFWCPSCQAHNRAAPEFRSSRVSCQECKREFWVVPMLLPTPVGAHAATPNDWVKPYGDLERRQGVSAPAADDAGDRGDCRDREETVEA